MTKSTNHPHAKRILLNGETRTLAEWLRFYNLKKVTYHARLKRGWSIKDALITPLRTYNRNPHAAPGRKDFKTATIPRTDTDERALSGRAGVYILLCRPSKRLYIGSSGDLRERKKQWSAILKGTSKKPIPQTMQADVQQYGPDAFEFKVHRFCDPNRVRVVEEKAIRTLRRKYPDALYNRYAVQKTLSPVSRTDTIKAKAAEHGISYHTVLQRLQRGLELEEALTTPPQDPRTNSPLVTLHGITMRRCEWLAQGGISAKRYKRRRKAGWSEARALLTPTKKVGE